MGSKTKIEWTRGADGTPGATWTPIRARNKATGKIGWHCEHVTPGCENCYSEGMNKRLGTCLPFKPGHRKDIEIFLDEEMLLAPLHWKKPRMIFVCSMTDAFADFVPDEWLDKMFAVAALCPQHTLQFLTKRSVRMRAYCSDPDTPECIASAILDFAATGVVTGVTALSPLGNRTHERDACFVPWPLPNCWLGVSAEDQRRADERVPDLLATPAVVRFVSAEPLLSGIDFNAIDLRAYVNTATGGRLGEPNENDPIMKWPLLAPFDHLQSGYSSPGLSWVIVGAESGPRARQMHPDWARKIRDDCAAAGIPFFMKQLSGPCGRAIKDMAMFPEDLRLREFPRCYAAAEGVLLELANAPVCEAL